MRFLPCFAALALTTASLAPRIADACGGGYGSFRRPSLALVATHWSEGDNMRSFVVFAGKATFDKQERWTLLAPMTFDHAAILDRGATNTKVTLVGEKGARVVTADRRVILNGSLAVDMDAHHAVEVKIDPNEQFAIAIVGQVYNASWLSLDALGWTEETTFDGNGAATVVIKNGKTTVGTYQGSALGVLDYYGDLYLVTKDGATARAFAL